MKKTLIVIVMIWLCISHFSLNAGYATGRKQQAAFCCGWIVLQIMGCADYMRDICSCCRCSKTTVDEDGVDLGDYKKLIRDVNPDLIEPLCSQPQSKDEDSDLPPLPQSSSRHSEMNIDEILKALSRSRVEAYVTNSILDFDSSEDDLHFKSTNPVDAADELFASIKKNKDDLFGTK